MKVLITTVPFGDKNSAPLDLLDSNDIEYLINPLNKKLTEDELIGLVSDFDVIIAGTEKISDRVMEKASNLRIISRVGIGLDSVDLLAAEKRNIKVSYTPDAPAPAVAELTIGMMLTLLRSVHVSNSQMHSGEWHRFFGRRLSKVVIGIIGIGRIGQRVLEHLQGFGNPRILVNDISIKDDISDRFNVEWVSKEEIYKQSDIVSLHLPLTGKTKNMITKDQLLLMKSDAIIINTSRGGIINENDLFEIMQSGHLSGAAIDVFDNEPYNGALNGVERCLLTAHMGSMSVDCRTQMEMEATEEAVRFLTGKILEGGVPDEEYEVQRKGL
ncbi:MAG: phosphoglycerate dehydrogenase [Candidatus Marinimicrobia bacterium]|jgi:D-3-phosphoglycerate dehydrogenase|nr:phosphoglycerate dehydrogenase [Candidatus Woesearchaeota archaeon]MBT6471077.1 phosphoglycerate dehydrogenase [Candidatus Neomarinimicrobiota bacterium]